MNAIPTIENALEAIKSLKLHFRRNLHPATFEKIDIINSVIEDIEREQSDWKAIEIWCKHEFCSAEVVVSGLNDWVWVDLTSANPEQHFRGTTRAEAIAAAAKWCREQNVKLNYI